MTVSMLNDRERKETYKPRGCSYLIPLGRLISCVRDMMVVDGEVCEEM